MKAHDQKTDHHDNSYTNIDKAALAGRVLGFYCNNKEGETALYDARHIVISDLMTDLLHLAQAGGHDIAEILAAAEHQFCEELAEENPAISKAGAFVLAKQPRKEKD